MSHRITILSLVRPDADRREADRVSQPGFAGGGSGHCHFTLACFGSRHSLPFHVPLTMEGARSRQISDLVTEAVCVWLHEERHADVGRGVGCIGVFPVFLSFPLLSFPPRLAPLIFRFGKSLSRLTAVWSYRESRKERNAFVFDES